MSSSWGLTEIVLEGEAANDVYALLSRAKEECTSEERDHCSEVIHTVKDDFCFAFGLENIYEDNGDDYWGPAEAKHTVRFFRKLRPMPGAVEAYDKLNEYFNVYILSTGPWGNSHSLCEKVEWIKEHLPSAHKNIIFSHHKDLCRVTI